MRLSLSRSLRDIRTSTYQICRAEERITGTTTFSDISHLTPEVRDILKKNVEKRRNCFGAFSLFYNIFFYLLLDFHVKTGIRFSVREAVIRDKRSRYNECRRYYQFVVC